MSIRLFNTVFLSLYSVLCCWSLETQSTCYPASTCPIYTNTSRPHNVYYLVQPKPVQFTTEPQDLVFFDGSDISLTCETNCVQQFDNLSCSVGFIHNGCDLDYIYDLLWVLSDVRVLGRRTLTIHNAISIANGTYRCFTFSPKIGQLPLTDRVIGRPIHLQVAALEPVGKEIVTVSEGGSIELPCMKGVFPNPSNISWWWNEDQCQSLQCQENIKISPSGALVLTNININMFGDNFSCEIGWNDHMTTYNATYQMIVDISTNSTNSSSTKTIKTSLKTEPPTIVSLNATIDHVSKGSAIYYKSDLLVDLLNDVDDYLINGTITCTFSGHPRPQVKWFLNGLNISECGIDIANIVTEGNTSVLYFNTTNPKSYFGSYQCVVDNEVGYASNTTRILPKGWSNPPEILPVRFHNIDITLTWGRPDYTGGETVQYYRVGVKDLDKENSTVDYLKTNTESNTLTFRDIEDYYGTNGKFYVQFTIEVVNDNAQPISDIAVVELDSRPKELHPEISSVDCTGRNVVVKWINHNQNAYSNIWDHCVYYNCSTSGGDVTGEMCTPYLKRSDVFTKRHEMELDNVPLSGKCSFRAMVLIDGYIYKWSNYETCTRNLSLSVVTSRMIDQVHTARDEVTFTCQATSEPISIIHWYFNDIPVNESDKYEISTELLNYKSKISELTVKSVESSDVGTYTCYATNGRSVDKSSGVLSVNVVPVITIPETKHTFNATESDWITCTAEGYPTPDIIWLNNNESEVDKDRLVTSSVMATGVGNITNKSITINIRRDDGGVYKCIATNSVGNDTETINFTVRSIPIVAIPEEYTVTEGGTITCEAIGYPIPDIKWLNNGSEVNESRLVNGTSMATGVGNLFSKSVSMIVRGSDDGVYTCVANNILGSDNSSVNITVQSLPVIDMPWTEQAYSVTEGNKITCRATGFPTPDIIWLNNDGREVDESRLVTGTSVATGVGNLVNVSVSMIVRRGDGGVYTCVANNSLGSDNSSVNITVHLLSEPVHSTSDVAIWVGVILSLLLLILLVLLLTTAVIWIRRRKHKAKSMATNQDFLKGLDGITDYDKLPKDNESLVEALSPKSMLGSMISIVTDVHIDMILRPPDIFSFLDINSETGDSDIHSDWSCESPVYDHYTTTKLHSSTTVIDSAATSATTTGSTNVDSANIDSGIDSHNKYSV